MGRTTAQPLSAGDAVLGLVIELPGNSYQLEQRLEGRFGSAQFSHATAYHALKRLAKQGLIRPVEDSSPAPLSAAAPPVRRERRRRRGGPACHSLRGDPGGDRALQALAAGFDGDTALT